ncbi:PIN domain-containing protein [Luteococcus japonicus]|uniref:PIN domain-containing protein n=1 Tax=Luteococcus japonicus TaxID=33984 RepID=UPI000B9A8975|nr:PIN domain-containing protein [Luteococcus japonicus]
MTQRVFVDANVLFSKTLMDWLFLLHQANGNMFQVHTTEDVLAETIANMRKRKPGAPGYATSRRLELIRDSLTEVIRDYPGQGDPKAPKFSGTDKDDYHVHAGACAGGANIILTCNAASDITTTPDEESHEVMQPDDFFCLVTKSNPSCLAPVVQYQLAYWTKRPSRLQLDDALRNSNCSAFADEVRKALCQIAITGWN